MPASNNGDYAPGSLYGQVVDAQTGALLGGARVFFRNDIGEWAISADRYGGFIVDPARFGTYEIAASHSGYYGHRITTDVESETRTNVTLSLVRIRSSAPSEDD